MTSAGPSASGCDCGFGAGSFGAAGDFGAARDFGTAGFCRAGDLGTAGFCPAGDFGAAGGADFFFRIMAKLANGRSRFGLGQRDASRDRRCARVRRAATSAILSCTRCILNSETSTTEAGATFRIDADRCIGCEACVESFPAIFQMRDAKAWVDARPIPGARPRSIVQACPVGAIVCDSAPQTEADVTGLPVVAGWETQWAAHRNDREDIAERERRYGRRLHVEALRQGWKLVIELPRTFPNHRLSYVHGIERESPEYDFTLQQLGPKTISLRAQIVGSALRFIAGKINSFPNSFKVDHHFPAAISACFHRRGNHAVEIYAFAVGVEDPLAALREAIRGR